MTQCTGLLAMSQYSCDLAGVGTGGGIFLGCKRGPRFLSYNMYIASHAPRGDTGSLGDEVHVQKMSRITLGKVARVDATVGPDTT